MEIPSNGLSNGLYSRHVWNRQHIRLLLLRHWRLSQEVVVVLFVVMGNLLDDRGEEGIRGIPGGYFTMIYPVLGDMKQVLLS